MVPHKCARAHFDASQVRPGALEGTALPPLPASPCSFYSFSVTDNVPYSR